VNLSHTHGEKNLVIINTDEVPVYFDMARRTTYHFKGDRSVKTVKTNGHKKRVTVCLAIASNGMKLPPMLIFKGEKSFTNPLSKKMYVTQNQNGWMTETKMKEWIEHILGKVKFPEKSVKLLVLDKCSSHEKDSVKAALKEKTDYLEFIPAGCTSLLQPLDLVINKPCKDALQNYYDDWLGKVGISEKNKTKNGYLRPPSYITICRWVNNAWSGISSELVKKSFYCGGI